MLKTLMAISLVTAVSVAPAFAQGEKELRAPVAPVLDTLPSKGLGSAAVIAGVAGAGLIGIVAFAASDDDDDSVVTITTTTVTPGT